MGRNRSILFNFNSISFRFSCFKYADLFLVLPAKSSYECIISITESKKKYPCLKLTEKLYTLVLNQYFLLIFVLSDEHDGTFCILYEI